MLKCPTEVRAHVPHTMATFHFTATLTREVMGQPQTTKQQSLASMLVSGLLSVVVVSLHVDTCCLLVGVIVLRRSCMTVSEEI